MRANAPGGFKAVELRHAAVHQDDVELHLNRSVEGGQAVADDFHAINAEALQRLAGDLLVYLAVIGDENICVGKLRQGFALSRGLCARIERLALDRPPLSGPDMMLV
jgi:hypothetical protein